MRTSHVAVLGLSSMLVGCSPQTDLGVDLDSSGPLRGAILSAESPGPGLDPHQDGRAPALRVVGLAWGRLVDVDALDTASGERTRVAVDLVVGPEILADGLDLEVDTHPITSTTTVTILHAAGTSAFRATWDRLETGLVPIAEKSLDPAELPPYTRVPRDAAIVVRFDDLLDPASLGVDSLQLWAGQLDLQRFPARAFLDPNHGGWADPDGDGRARFYPTRVILDTTTSEVEALASSAPTQVHAEGLPPSRYPSMSNVAVRIPTQGEGLLHNLSGRGPSSTDNGSVDASSPGLEVVRAFRSGGSDDPYAGLLVDLQRPRVVGSQAVEIEAVALDPQGGPQDFVAILRFLTPSCARAAVVRDVLATVGSMAAVTRDSSQPNGAQLARVHLRLLAGSPLTTGSGILRSAYDPVRDEGREACFVRFSPEPLAEPNRGVSPASQVIVEFSEPMDPLTLSPFETWTLTSVAQPAGPRDYVAAEVTANVQLDRFTLLSVLPLDHVAGTNEAYFANLASGPEGPRDQAGLPLRDALPQVRFTLDPQAPTQRAGNYVLSFTSTDEDGNGNPEIRGQFLYDLTEGAIRPRSVSRFAAAATREKPVPSIMPIPPFGVQTPLSSLGSKLHAMWRYCDVGLGLMDESFYNVDVEGLDWAPVGGNVVSDVYDRFEILLSHGLKLPDETLNPATLLPLYRNSGLVTTYASNVLDPVNDPQKIVHPRARGYTLNPADRFLSNTTPAVTMMPFPLNRSLPPDQHVFYTWRDTALQALGAPVEVQGSPGAELAIVVQVTGSGTTGQPYLPGQVPTIGLPLLMEYKCFSDDDALGLNAFDVNIAINSSSMPNFRAYSTGGTNSSGQGVVIDPDNEPVARGGFNPNSTPPGQPTIPVDNVFYIGQMDLVVRVSRLHGVWIDTGSANPTYAPPVVEPRAADQPAGTQVLLAFRGATAVIPALQADANLLDAYGEGSSPGSVTFFNGDDSWKGEITQLHGARLLQFRASLVSNAATNTIPTVSGLGLCFQTP